MRRIALLTRVSLLQRGMLGSFILLEFRYVVYITSLQTYNIKNHTDLFHSSTQGLMQYTGAVCTLPESKRLQSDARV